MPRKYDQEYKIQAVKLAQEIGGAKAARELGVPADTVYAWMSAAKKGRLDMGVGCSTPDRALSMAEQIELLTKQNKALAKENRRLKETNEFLEEASAFFAASRLKSGKTNE
jgi:transposase